MCATPKRQPAASPGRRIAAEVLTWEGTGSEIGPRGELSFRVGRREIGHLHGDTIAHFFFAGPLWAELHAAGRITPHPVFPGKTGPAERRIATDADVDDVLALLRINHAAAVRRSHAG